MIVLLAVGVVTVGSWGTLLAFVGRSTFPARERLPLRSWRPDDLRRNAQRGMAQMATFDARVHRLGTH